MAIIRMSDRVQCDCCEFATDVDSVVGWLKVSRYEVVDTRIHGDDLIDRHFCGLDCLKHYYGEGE